MNYSTDDNPNERLKNGAAVLSSSMMPGMMPTLWRPQQHQQHDQHQHQQHQNFPSSGSINSVMSSADETTTSTAVGGDEYENISHLHLQENGQWIVQHYENCDLDEWGGSGDNNENNKKSAGMKGPGGTIDLARYELSLPQVPSVPSAMAYGTMQDPMTAWATSNLGEGSSSGGESAQSGAAAEDPVHKKIHTEQQPASGVGMRMMEMIMEPAGSTVQQQQHHQRQQEQQAQQYHNLFDDDSGGVASAPAFQPHHHQQNGYANFSQNIDPRMPSAFVAEASVDSASNPNVTNTDNINPAMIMDGSGETMLAREMAKLTVNEREKVTQDIHGVSDDAVVETDDLIQQKLEEIDRRLMELGGTTPTSSNMVTVASATSPSASMGNNSNTDRNKDQDVNMSAYNLAMSIDARYVTNAKLRIMFLRSCDFDVDKAAKRMAVHFDKKMELFGASKLCQTISQQDLNSDDQECLQSGQSQLLPYRDVSGRAVFFQALSHYKYKEVVNAVSFPLSLSLYVALERSIVGRSSYTCARQFSSQFSSICQESEEVYLTVSHAFFDFSP